MNGYIKYESYFEVVVLNLSTLALPESSVSDHKVSQFLVSSSNSILNVILYIILVLTLVLFSFEWGFF